MKGQGERGRGNGKGINQRSFFPLLQKDLFTRFPSFFSLPIPFPPSFLFSPPLFLSPLRGENGGKVGGKGKKKEGKGRPLEDRNGRGEAPTPLDPKLYRNKIRTT